MSSTSFSNALSSTSASSPCWSVSCTGSAASVCGSFFSPPASSSAPSTSPVPESPAFASWVVSTGVSSSVAGAWSSTGGGESASPSSAWGLPGVGLGAQMRVAIAPIMTIVRLATNSAGTPSSVPFSITLIMVLIIGAPPNTIGITKIGFPPKVKERMIPRAPIAPQAPAARDPNAPA